MTPRKTKSKPRPTALVRRVREALDSGKTPRRPDVYALTLMVPEKRPIREERTSARVAAIASAVLALDQREVPDKTRLIPWRIFPDGRMSVFSITAADLRSLAASALTQARDKPSPRRRSPATKAR